MKDTDAIAAMMRRMAEVMHDVTQAALERMESHEARIKTLEAEVAELKEPAGGTND